MIYILIGYMWLFIHRPFEVWPWLGDLHIERVYMFVTIFYWLFLAANKSWTSNRINLGIALMVVAVCMSTLVSACASFDSGLVQDWFKVLVFYVLLMSCVNEERQLQVIMVAFVVIMGLYELHSLREFFCGRGVSRMGIWRMVGVGLSFSDPNSFAATVAYGIPIISPILLLAEKKWQYFVLIGLIVLAITCILLTGSRSGFACLVLLFLGVSLISKYRLKLIFLGIVAVPLVWMSLSLELQDRYLTLIDPSHGPANAEASAESRMVFYHMAVDIWKKHPIFGVGPGCFSVESGTGMQSHTLYAQTISNLGIVGVFALLVFVLCYLNNFREGHKLYKSLLSTKDTKFLYFLLVATTIGLFQLLFLGLAGHNFFRFTWLWFGAFSALAVKFLRRRNCLYN